MPLGRPLSLTVAIMNWVETLKAFEDYMAIEGTVCVFRKGLTLEDAVGSCTCLLEALVCV
jgi:hypothetical protein